jgi:ABC-2 type transport system ATP-binding protein
VRDEIVVEVQGLRKHYGEIRAVDDVSFSVYRGEIFGMVGPNGAGKTTTIECIEGLRRPDGGSIEVMGLDPQGDGYALRERIGVQLQESFLYDPIRVWEALDLFASFYPRAADWESLLERLGLADRRKASYKSLSGGQKQRLAIALALVSDPEIIFLDELTTGLDPQARRAMWDLVRQMREEGKTVFLTTHYMEEAEELCDRVLIIDHGRIVALDKPEELIANLGGETRIIFTPVGSVEPAALEAIPGVNQVESSGERVTIYAQEITVLVELLKEAEAGGWKPRHLHTEEPTLEDVFLTLTGKEMRD